MDACSSPFSFPHVGVTCTAPPLPETVASEGWTLDHNRVQVGLRCLQLHCSQAPIVQQQGQL